ncbi:MAG: hypothetical protein RLZ12_416 [Bacillota bacterium]|jgi:putative ABC transport system substrate-binding protein
MKKLIVSLSTLAVIALALVFFPGCSNDQNSSALPKICILQTANHPALDKTVQGIKTSLTNKYSQQGITIVTESAQSNPTLAKQIAEKFKRQNPSIVVGVGTMPTQTLQATCPNIPLVFASVTDPKGAGLVKEPKNPKNNITGVSNTLPLNLQTKILVLLLKKIAPVNTSFALGFPYDPKEPNSLSLIRLLTPLAKQEGITLKPQAVSSTAEVPQAAAKLSKLGLQAHFVSNDSTILSSLINFTQTSTVPVISSDTDTINSATLAFGPSQTKVGQTAGELIISILNGKKASELDILYPTLEDLEIVANEKDLKRFKITLSNAELAEIKKEAIRLTETKVDSKS